MPFNRLSLVILLALFSTLILLGTFFMSETGELSELSDAKVFSAQENNDIVNVSPQPNVPLDSAVIEADSKAPTIPSNLQLVVASTKSVEISWDPSSDRGGTQVEGYQLYRDGRLLQADVPHSASPSFVDSTVRAQSAYIYGVLAFDSAGNTSVMRQITVRTPHDDYTPPSIPSNLKILMSDSSNVTLSWDESIDGESGLSGYLIYRDGKLIERVSEPWFHDSNLSEQTSYTYLVSSLDDADPPNESPKRTIKVMTRSLIDAGR